MANGYGYNPSAPPAGYAGYPPPPAGYPPPGGYPPPPAAGMAYPNVQANQDPAYPPPAYSDVVGAPGSVPSAPPATDSGGNAYYNPANPQQAYIPQTNPPPYAEKPKME